MNILIILLTVIIALAFIFWQTTPMLIFTNKQVNIKKIVKSNPKKYGELLINKDEYEIKFLWKLKKIKFTNIKKISAYSRVDFGLENQYKFLEIHTINHEIVSFDPYDHEHKEIISRIIKIYFNKSIDLEEFYPPPGADDNGDIFVNKG